MCGLYVIQKKNVGKDKKYVNVYPNLIYMWLTR